MNMLYHTKSVTFWNKSTFSQTSSVQDIPVILKWHNLQSLNKALDFFIEKKIERAVLYLLAELAQKYKVATYEFLFSV